MSETPRPDEQCCETPVEDLCAGALAHYADISAKAHHWHNQIPQAIKFWYLDKPRLERENADLRRQLAEERGRVGEALRRTGVGDMALSTKDDCHSWVSHAKAGDPELESIVWCQYCGRHQIHVPDWTDNPVCDGLAAIRALTDPQQSEQNAGPAGVVVPEYIVERAAQLLESAADFGIQHQWADGSTTPNADACRQTAAALLTAAAKEPK